jgi:hypothetical protein
MPRPNQQRRYVAKCGRYTFTKITPAFSDSSWNDGYVVECGGAPPLLDGRHRRERKARAFAAKAAEHRRTPQRKRNHTLPMKCFVTD